MWGDRQTSWSIYRYGTPWVLVLITKCIENLYTCSYKLFAIQHRHVVKIRFALVADKAIIVYACSAIELTSFSGNYDHSIGSTGTPDRSRSSIFKQRDAFYI